MTNQERIERLRAARTDARLSQLALSQAMDLPDGKVGAWESGRQELSQDNFTAALAVCSQHGR